MYNIGGSDLALVKSIIFHREFFTTAILLCLFLSDSLVYIIYCVLSSWPRLHRAMLAIDQTATAVNATLYIYYTDKRILCKGESFKI